MSVFSRRVLRSYVSGASVCDPCSSGLTTSMEVVFAFPMVLAGTSLTALVAYFIFPYGWSFDLCMTFGSILAATDPVAVAVLLNELGAPPRLKVRAV